MVLLHISVDLLNQIRLKKIIVQIELLWHHTEQVPSQILAIRYLNEYQLHSIRIFMIIQWFQFIQLVMNIMLLPSVPLSKGTRLNNFLFFTAPSILITASVSLNMQNKCRHTRNNGKGQYQQLCWSCQSYITSLHYEWRYSEYYSFFFFK